MNITNVPIIGESVKSALTVELFKSFPGITIYREQVTQNIQFPQFFINQLTLTQRKEGQNTWWLRYLVNIRFRAVADIATEPNLQTRLDGMAIDMTSRLQTINLGGLQIPVRSPRTEKVDGVLQYFCNVEIRVTKKLVEQIKQIEFDLNTIVEER